MIGYPMGHVVAHYLGIGLRVLVAALLVVLIVGAVACWGAA